MLQIYCGNGKGKTSAAIGAAVRASGAGMRVYFVQFLKNGSSSEIGVLDSLENITVRTCRCCDKFTFLMNEEELSALTCELGDMLDDALRTASSGGADMLILDEFLDAYEKGFVDRQKADTLTETARNCEVILTGRKPPESFASAADYISEITAVKHPYQKGITARKGIEY